MIFDEPPENQAETLIHDRIDSSLHFRTKIPVGILGATGSVGQRLIQLLDKHPWFELVYLAASDKTNGKTYKEAVNWQLPTPLPEKAGKLLLKPCEPGVDCKIIFSALPAAVAGDVEVAFAKAGYVVISMAKSHRMDPDVPIMIPEVNADHLELVSKQPYGKSKGMIIAKPNCAAIGLALALRPLILEFGVKAVHVVTMQALSGAGFPGVPSMQLLDNIIPYIEDEENRLENEPHKILGEYKNGAIIPYACTISSSCTRVPVTEGHLEVVSVQLAEKPSAEEVIRAWEEFYPPVQELKLPSSPVKPLYYFSQKDLPQPKLQRDLDNGMAVSIGRLRKCQILDYKFVTLSHNTIRGAAGGALLIAEYLVKKGHVFW